MDNLKTIKLKNAHICKNSISNNPMLSEIYIDNCYLEDRSITVNNGLQKVIMSTNTTFENNNVIAANSNYDLFIEGSVLPSNYNEWVFNPAHTYLYSENKPNEEIIPNVTGYCHYVNNEITIWN